MGENAPKFEIILDKPRNMQFTFGVAKKFKELTGKSVTDVNKGLDFEEIATLLYLMLQVEDKELTEEEALDLLHVKNSRQYIDALKWLIGESTPEADDEDPKAGTPTG